MDSSARRSVTGSGKPAFRDPEGAALTTALLILSAVLALSAAAFTLPFTPRPDVLSPRVARIAWDWGALQLPAVGLAALAWHLVWRRRQVALARGPLVQVAAGQWWHEELLRQVPPLGQTGIAVHVLGSGEISDPEPSQPVPSPAILLPGSADGALRFTGATLARLIRDPVSLRAVVLHELGHAFIRDARYLSGVRNALLWFLPVQAVAVALQLLASTAEDCGNDGSCGPALVASLLGKSLIVLATLQTAAGLLLVRLLADARERVADNFALANGADGVDLERAAALLAGGSAPASARHRRAVFHLSRRWSFVSGAIVGTVVHGLLGVLFHIAELFREAHLQSVAVVAVPWLEFFLGYLLLLRPAARTRASGRPQDSSLFAYGAGAWTAFAIGQTWPGLLVSFMPEGYSYVVRNDPSGLLFNLFLVYTVDTLGLVAALVLSRPLARHRYFAPTCGAALAIACGVRIWGGLLTARLFEALLLAAAGALLVTMTIREGRRATLRAGAAVAAFALLFALGFHSPTLASQVALREAEAELDKGVAAAAVPLLTSAVVESPRMYGAYVVLGDAYAAMNEHRHAARSYERALSVGTLSSWDEKMRVIGSAADSYLSSDTGSGVQRARQLLATARAMRRANSRVDRVYTATALLTEAQLIGKHGTEDELPFATFLIAEGLAMVPDRAAAVLEELITFPEVQRLGLADGASYVPSELDLSKGVPAYAEDLWAQVKNLPVEDQLAFGRLLVRGSARGGS